jgi:hypothetical protein
MTPVIEVKTNPSPAVKNTEAAIMNSLPNPFIALITGAARGIGEATARRLTREPWLPTRPSRSRGGADPKAGW